MATQIVMDHTGHSSHEFDVGDVEGLAKARGASGSWSAKGL